MKKLIILLLLTASINTEAQNVGIGTTTPNASAMLEVNSTNRGMLPPRMMATQRNAIITPADGLVVYDTDSAALMIRSGGAWRQLTTTATPGGFWQGSGLNIFNANTGNVGLGTNNPQARLHVADSNVLFFATGDAQLSLAPLGINGPGRRMLWFPGRAAFRVGYAINEWDQDSIGRYSFASGWRTRALSVTSTSMGESTRAFGGAATAMGSNTNAGGYASLAGGFATTTGGYAATALGFYTQATGSYSTAFGYSSLASGATSLAMGYETKATNNDAVAMNQQTTAQGVGSTAMGLGTKARAGSSLAIGRYNDSTDAIGNGGNASTTDRLFQIGNGTADNQRSNALTVLANGHMGVGLLNPQVPLHFAQLLGKKISLYRGASGDAGFAVFGNELRMHSDYNGAAITFGYDDLTNGFTERMRLTGSGNLGIGTTTPNAPLQFSNGLANRKLVLYETANNDHQFYGLGINSGVFRFQTDASSADYVFNTALSFTQSQELLRIKGNGNIGIGVSNPQAQLQLANTIANRKIVLADAFNNDNEFYGFGLAASPVPTGNFELRYQVDQPINDHVFYTGSSPTTSQELLRIKGTGNIGINQGEPSAYGHGGINRVLEIWNNASVGGDVQSQLVLSTSGGSGSMGGITWATTALGGEQKAAFAGAAYETGTNNALFQILLRNNGNLARRFAVFSNGNATLQGTLTQLSDARLKTNIHFLQSSLQNIQQLHGYSYYWKDKDRDSTVQIGLLAQEVQKLYPQLVKQDDKGMLSVNYMGVVPVLLEAIKEQQKQITDQAQAMAKLQQQVASQNQKLKKLEALLQELLKK
jgi:hypothetical protein